MADDIVTRLRGWSQFIQESDPFSYRVGESADLHREAADEIERLCAVIDAVDDLHDLTSVEDPRCASCGDWPCPTHLIVCDECKEARRG